MQSACSDGVQRQTRQVRQGDPLGFVQEVRCQGEIEVIRPCAGKGRRNRHVMILWDFNIQTDHVIEHRRPDVVLDKHEKMCHLINIAVPGESRVTSKENEKVQKYQNSASCGKSK